MSRLTEYADMNPRAKAVVEAIAGARGIDPARINNVWKALARHPARPPALATGRRWRPRRGWAQTASGAARPLRCGPGCCTGTRPRRTWPRA